MFVIFLHDVFMIDILVLFIQNLFQNPDIKSRKMPILFFANKNDAKETMSSVKVSQMLGLEKIMDKPWHICPANTTTGEGLSEGVEWLTSRIKNQLESK